jgi:hypothetical protein
MMEVQEKNVFHCSDCGHIVHVTNQTDAPICCGRLMCHAFKERTSPEKKTLDYRAVPSQPDFMLSRKGKY